MVWGGFRKKKKAPRILHGLVVVVLIRAFFNYYIFIMNLKKLINFILLNYALI